MRNRSICRTWIASFVLSAASISAHAHGDEPHGDAPHSTAAAGSSGPRFEAATDAFEIVGRLETGAFTLYINRFQTSEPVLQAKVELESGELKAVAAYEPSQGSYRLTDPKFVQALSQPGSHPVLVAVQSGNEADLLEATLVIEQATSPGNASAPRLPVLIAGAGVLVAGGLAVLVWRKRRVKTTGGGK